MLNTKLLKLSIAIVLLLSLFASSAYAEPNETAGSSEHKKSLSNAGLLTKKEILSIVQSNLEGYLKTDLQTAGKSIVPSSGFIPVHDVDRNLFAYMVPLMEKGKEIGYITVGAIEDGYSAYDIFIQDQVTEKIKARLNEKSASKKVSLVLIPPFQYVIHVEENQTEQFIDITDISKEKDISEAIKIHKMKLREQYSSIRSEENKARMQKLLQQSPQAIAAAAVTPENVSLTVERDFGMFVPVELTGSYSYGGNQMWWPVGSDKQVRGCGPVAAANITNYLAKIKDSSKYGKLYTGSTNSKTDFMNHMDALYSYISPGAFGEVSVSDFASDVERYARDKGVTLSRVTSSASFTLDNTANYIKAGLSINSPVATLNTKKYSEYEYEWHWMTITKYFRDSADNRWIAASTWGNRHSIDYRVHFNAMAYGWWVGGLMYFK